MNELFSIKHKAYDNFNLKYIMNKNRASTLLSYILVKIVNSPLLLYR